MSGTGNAMDRILAEYSREVLRWNGQINLISRQDSSTRLAALVRQCRGGWDNLAAAGDSGLAGASRLWYFDLGSGAGLPGIVWHAQLVARGIKVWTRLVEPREKRAWFLERTARLVGLEHLGVLACRWEDAGKLEIHDFTPENNPSHVLISLKALHLTDSAVLEGLTPFFMGATIEDGIPVLIARFYPPDQTWTGELAAELDIVAKDQVREVSGVVFGSEGGRVLSPATLPGASLVLSGYVLRSV